MGFLGRLLGGRPPEPDRTFVGLRSQVLGLRPEAVGIGDGGAPIYGILMETGFRDGSATFVCLRMAP